MAQFEPRDWVAIFATILIPLAIAIVGYWVSSAIKESENRVKYIELAIGILEKPPSTDNENIRLWAIEVMDKYSEVPINEKMKLELTKSPIRATLNKTLDDLKLRSEGTVK